MSMTTAHYSWFRRPLRATDEPRPPSEFLFSHIRPKDPLEKVPVLNPAVLQHLAQAIVHNPRTADSSNPAIPAGFTYLGQFIAHDLTFDMTRRPLGAPAPEGGPVQGRSPALDLDSLYGAGPAKAPHLYQDHARLKVGTTARTTFPDPDVDVELPGFDLPRVGSPGATKRERQTALIPDTRNDDNLLVAQIHLAFIRFHNRVVKELSDAGVPADTLWERAQATVTKYYQRMVLTDFLPRVLDPGVLDDVLQHGRRHFERTALPTTPPTMPVEFAFAAFRFGHSMVRERYELNRVFQTRGPNFPAKLGLLLRFSGTSGNLSPDGDWDDPDTGAFDRLATNWVVDWRRFFDFGEAGIDGLTPPAGTFNVAKRIDTLLSDPLHFLPLGSLLRRSGTPTPAFERNLAYRTLIRGAGEGLPTGQQMAELFEVDALNEVQLTQGDRGVAADRILQDGGVFTTTPLWFYVLREAEVNGGRLGAVGSRIVAETFHRAIEGSPISILRDPDLELRLGPDANTFKMAHLLHYAFEGTPELLNPLGDG